MVTQTLLEWTATGLSLLGALLVALPSVEHRRRGFLVWLVANGLWIVWAAIEQKWGVLTLFSAYQATSALGWWHCRRPPPTRAAQPDPAPTRP